MVTYVKPPAGCSLRPSVFIDVSMFDRLQGVALAAMHRTPDAAERLLDEIERAEVVPSSDMPAKAVTIGSRVTFKDEWTDRLRTVELVMPVDADISKGRVSVLTPIGAALIGLLEGASIEWDTNVGSRRELTIVEVQN